MSARGWPIAWVVAPLVVTAIIVDLCIAADLVVQLAEPLAGRVVRNAGDGAEVLRDD